MAKYRMLREQVERTLPGVVLSEAPVANDGELALAHEPTYVTAVREGWLDRAQQREIGFPWTPRMVDRSRRSVGATIAAARVALQQGIAANLAGGTHHAFAHKGSGYCVFNDVAVAARLMQAEVGRLHRRLLRVAIVDLDVHQGNGTAAIFKDDPTVFTLSLHGENNFPFRKEPSDLDVDLPDDCTDAPYLQAQERAMALMFERFEPGLIIYLAGADPYEGDRLGRLKLTRQGLAARDARVFAAACRRRVPVVVTMAGGYGYVIEDTVAIQLQTIRAAYAHWCEWNNRNDEQTAA